MYTMDISLGPSFLTKPWYAGEPWIGREIRKLLRKERLAAVRIRRAINSTPQLELEVLLNLQPLDLIIHDKAAKGSSD